jgi:hypothetical protein
MAEAFNQDKLNPHVHVILDLKYQVQGFLKATIQINQYNNSKETNNKRKNKVVSD